MKFKEQYQEYSKDVNCTYDQFLESIIESMCNKIYYQKVVNTNLEANIFNSIYYTLHPDSY